MFKIIWTENKTHLNAAGNTADMLRNTTPDIKLLSRHGKSRNNPNKTVAINGKMFNTKNKIKIPAQ